VIAGGCIFKYIKIGKMLTINFKASVVGSNSGNGIYYIDIPNSYLIDTALVTLDVLPSQSGNNTNLFLASKNGSGWYSTNFMVYPVALSSSKLMFALSSSTGI